MRRGALIVGEERRSLLHDLSMIPALLIAFVGLAVRHIRILFFGRANSPPRKGH
jgi:hypothetical protein